MIELQNVCRTFTVGDQQVAALRDINLRLDASEYISIMGPSGSGKSTLLNLLGLLDRPTSGTYLLDDGNVTDLSDEQQAQVRREKIGFVFQSFHLVPRLTAAQNVELPHDSCWHSGRRAQGASASPDAELWFGTARRP